ncbi:MAG: carboxylesterase family protein [Deltaproteobacteria bacterium]|nr:carboxylesterase family protein [Deltaproteobacteria bacterium]
MSIRFTRSCAWRRVGGALLCLGLAACTNRVPAALDGSAQDGALRDAGPGGDASPRDARRTDGGGGDLSGDPTVAHTMTGLVRGKLLGKVRAHLGIPYAAPPVGGLRFGHPQPLTSWSGVRETTALGPSCPQKPSTLTSLPNRYSEDCLTLNVWAPFPAPSKPAPVMVFIHGGGFTLGGSAQPLYDGTALVEQTGVVLVTFNYRLGPLGFLAHARTPYGGNAALYDQRAVLRWVKQNIGAFGGDGTNVTVFGESAGSVSVCAHLVSPEATGPLNRAIMESGPCSGNLLTLAEAQAQGKALAEKLGCESATDVQTCLGSKSTQEVLDALPTKDAMIFGTGVSWGPVAGTPYLPAQPAALMKAGSFAKVPLLLGTNRDEGTLFVLLGGLLATTAAQYPGLATTAFGAKAPQVLAQYPLSSYASPAHAIADLLGDVGFVCPTRRTARAAVAGGVSSTYLYHFTQPPSFALVPFLAVFHTAELPFVFQNPGGAKPLTAEEQQLARSMLGYWTRFAATGDPNGGGAPAWPAYAAGSDQHLELGPTIKVGSGLKQAACDFWDGL